MWSVGQEEICHTDKVTEAGTRPWTNKRKSTQDERVQLRSMVETQEMNTILRKKAKHNFWLGLLQVDEHLCFERLWKM